MKFNDTSGLTGIIQQIERKADFSSGYISGDATRLKEFTAMVNNESHKVWHTIFMSNGNWQYDDSNNTDLPMAVTDLVSGTATYSIPTTALTVQRVEIKDSSANWYQLTPITKELLNGLAVEEFQKTDSLPMYYRLINGVIELFPASNYASTGGLRVYFDRDSVDFVYNATTATPGFASPYHEILPIGASIEYLKIKQPASPTLPQLQADYLKIMDDIKKFYGKRFKDYHPKIGRAKQNFK